MDTNTDGTADNPDRDTNVTTSKQWVSREAKRARAYTPDPADVANAQKLLSGLHDGEAQQLIRELAGDRPSKFLSMLGTLRAAPKYDMGGVSSPGMTKDQFDAVFARAGNALWAEPEPVVLHNRFTAAGFAEADTSSYRSAASGWVAADAPTHRSVVWFGMRNSDLQVGLAPRDYASSDGVGRPVEVLLRRGDDGVALPARRGAEALALLLNKAEQLTAAASSIEFGSLELGRKGGSDAGHGDVSARPEKDGDTAAEVEQSEGSALDDLDEVPVGAVGDGVRGAVVGDGEAVHGGSPAVDGGDADSPSHDPFEDRWRRYYTSKALRVQADLSPHDAQILLNALCVSDPEKVVRTHANLRATGVVSSLDADGGR